jgi:anhydro-N-acetylmuramic acid kinase
VIAIGLMSGTSMDAVDVAVVRFPGELCELVCYRQYPIPDPVVLALQEAGPTSAAADIVRLDAQLGELFAECVSDAIRQSGLGAGEISVIGSHGQTLIHCPQAAVRNTLQIGDPNRIAYVTGIRTVADLRRMDLAAGGQGAPLAPAFHAWRFRSDRHVRLVINIGGIANISILPPAPGETASGFDTGPGNTLLDQWVQKKLGKPMDHDGEWAASGIPNLNLLERLCADPYFVRPPPKSTGRDYFNLEWFRTAAGVQLAELHPADVQATLLELTARTVAHAARTHAKSAVESFVCGGGASNSRLMTRLRELLAPMHTGTTAELGVPPDAVEAMMVAWIAKCRVEGIPANLPSVTGAARPVLLGGIYEPGKQP